MNPDLLHTLYLSLAFLALFGSAEILYRFLNVKAELTRKWVHFGTGILTFLFPVYLNSHWWVLLLCGSFAVILLSSLKWNYLPSINAVDRITHGSLLYPLSVYLVFLIYVYQGSHLHYFFLPIIILAICDPLAALFGKRYTWMPYSIAGNKKSVTGSLVFLFSASILIYLFLPPTYSLFGSSVLYILALATIATLAESVSNKGWDNFLIPMSVSTFLFISESCL